MRRVGDRFCVGECNHTEREQFLLNQLSEGYSAQEVDRYLNLCDEAAAETPNLAEQSALALERGSF